MLVERFSPVYDAFYLQLAKGTGMSTDATLLAIGQHIPVLLIEAQTHFPLSGLLARGIHVPAARPGTRV